MPSPDFSKKYPWWSDACDLVLGLKRRPLPSVPRLTHPKWDTELAALQEMAQWVLWNHGGRKPPRPKVWTRAPQWAKDALARYERAHPKPKPGPQPPSQDKKVCKWSVEQVGGFGFRLAWVFQSGARTGSYTPESLVDLVKGAREPRTGQPIRFLSLEGWPQTDDCSPGETNEPFMHRLRDACHAARNADGKPIQFRIWERTDDCDFAHVKRMIDTYQPDVYEPDLEDWPNKDGTIARKLMEQYPNLPLLTLYAGLPDVTQPSETHDQLEGWFKAAAPGTQTYAHEAWPGGVPADTDKRTEGMDLDVWWRAHGMGLDVTIPGLNGKSTIPMIGVNQEGDVGVQHQLPAVAAWGEHWGIEWFESCEPADLALFGV